MEMTDTTDDGTLAGAAALLSQTGIWHPAAKQRSIAITSSGTHDITVSDEDLAIMIASDLDVTLQERAQGGRVSIIAGQGTRLKYCSAGAGKRIVYLRRDASLDWIDATDGRSESIAYLAEDGANAKFRSLFLGIGSEEHSAHVQMIHKGSRTVSNMLTRVALMGSSRGTYRGTITIHPGAHGCVAHQRQDTLLLGSTAKMDSLPVLEISDNDVKCSHGVTIGQVDEEQLFYLESRGILRTEALQMIVGGFFDQLLISMGDQGSALRHDVQQRVRHG